MKVICTLTKSLEFEHVLFKDLHLLHLHHIMVSVIKVNYENRNWPIKILSISELSWDNENMNWEINSWWQPEHRASEMMDGFNNLPDKIAINMVGLLVFIVAFSILSATSLFPDILVMGTYALRVITNWSVKHLTIGRCLYSLNIWVIDLQPEVNELKNYWVISRF